MSRNKSKHSSNKPSSSFFPNKKDNFKQILLKLIFIISLLSLIISSVYIINYFVSNMKQDKMIEDTREIWYSTVTDPETETPEITPESPAVAEITEINNDFLGWIRLSGTKVNHPIYQADDNEYYLNHNGNRKRSAYGALYFDSNNIISPDYTDKNLVIFGHEMKNGAMFGTLKKLRSIDFYKSNPTIEFSTIYASGNYHIYSIFVLNADRTDDNDYIYNIYKNNFRSEEEFDFWVDEAMQRSVITTGVSVEYGDDIITLVTCCNDFPNARLVVMARKARADEPQKLDTSNAVANPNPRFPDRWYSDKGIENPFKKVD